MMTTAEIADRCTLRIRGRAVNVADTGTVRVYDDVAGHYSVHHDLTDRELDRVRRAAATERDRDAAERDADHHRDTAMEHGK